MGDGLGHAEVVEEVLKLAGRNPITALTSACSTSSNTESCAD